MAEITPTHTKGPSMKRSVNVVIIKAGVDPDAWGPKVMYIVLALLL